MWKVIQTKPYFSRLNNFVWFIWGGGGFCAPRDAELSRERLLNFRGRLKIFWECIKYFMKEFFPLYEILKSVLQKASWNFRKTPTCSVLADHVTICILSGLEWKQGIAENWGELCWVLLGFPFQKWTEPRCFNFKLHFIKVPGLKNWKARSIPACEVHSSLL